MAEAIILGLGVSVVQETLLVAFGKLKNRFQQAKATEGEFRELEVFLRSIQDCCEKYDHTGGTVTTTTTTTTTTLTTTATTPSSFAEALNDVQKKMEKWSSQNCRFFSRSSPSDRVQKLQAIRRKLQDAMDLENFRMNKENFTMNKENFRMMTSMYRLGRNNDGQTEISQLSQITIETSTAIDDPHCHNTNTTRVNTLTGSQVTTTTTTTDEVESSSQVTIMTTTTDQVSTHLAGFNSTRRPPYTRSRSKSVERDWSGTIPSNLPTSKESSRSKSVERDWSGIIPSNLPTSKESSRSKSVKRDWPGTIPNNLPTSKESSQSKSVERDRHHLSEKETKSDNFDHYDHTNEEESTAQIPCAGEKGRTFEFWVPLDSEKQRRDMEKRLKLLPGVKRIVYELDKMVWVEVGEGSNVDTDTLLREMRCAWPKHKKQEPTLWSDRPD